MTVDQLKDFAERAASLCRGDVDLSEVLNQALQAREDIVQERGLVAGLQALVAEKRGELDAAYHRIRELERSNLAGLIVAAQSGMLTPEEARLEALRRLGRDPNLAQGHGPMLRAQGRLSRLVRTTT